MTWPPRNKCADEKQRPCGEGEEEEAGEEEVREEPLRSTKSEGGLEILQCMGSLWELSALGKGRMGSLSAWRQMKELATNEILYLGKGD